MAAAERIVIAGGGAAAHGAVAGMRRAGFTGEVVLIGREQDPPYERPPLSKRYLIEDIAREELRFRHPDCELRLGQEVVEVHPEAHRVSLAGGESLSYGKLLLATGGRARRLPGFEAAMRLRDIGDADRLKAALSSGKPLAVIGAGFIGCEVAVAGRAHGIPVTVYEALSEPLERVLGPEVGRFLAEAHRSHGVDLHTGVRRLPDMPGNVLVGVGSEPNTELAEAAGIACDGGILVDELGRTDAPDTYAAGDCARFFSPLFESRVRVEHFQTAHRHGTAVGRSMAGEERPFAEAPWFWSDQYDLNIQYVGAALPWEQLVVRGRIGEVPFTAFYLAGDRLLGAVSVNDNRTLSQARRLMERRVEVRPDQLADESVNLRELAAA
jgi:3-phenylpropionate/trans-cinnamate dioxygenase ferredoxin reductase subunit